MRYSKWQLIGIIALLLVFKINSGHAAVGDTLEPEQRDTVSLTYRKHSPKKAAWMSTIIPGLGQVYNDKYWKVPVIYAAGGACVYFINQNGKLYREYKQAYNDFINGEIEQYKGYDRKEELQTVKNYYRNNRDLSYILLGLTYIANILDASVDAHLYYFDVSKDLSMKIEPTQIQSDFSRPIPAISCSIYF